MFTGRDRVQIKTPDQIELMREAGLVVGRALALLTRTLAPGMTTADLDAVAEEYIRGQGAVPSFKGYNGFPATICVSVNDEIVHGIPGARVIDAGDLVSIDCGAIVEGWHGDAAVTVGVGKVTDRDAELMRVTEEALWRGLAAAQVGGRLTDISYAVETAIRSAGTYGVVEEYVGHGIGTQMHMDPQVPNYGPAGKGLKLVAGMALAVEPMVNLGGRHTRVLADEWTVVTVDGSRSAHFEHTVALTEAGPWVLTALDGGAERFAGLGVATPAGFPAPPAVP